jgi:hypothetical protein
VERSIVTFREESRKLSQSEGTASVVNPNKDLASRLVSTRGYALDELKVSVIKTLRECCQCILHLVLGIALLKCDQLKLGPPES